MPDAVAEFVTFRLEEAVSAQQFLSLSQASEAFCRAQPGFLRRDLSEGPDGKWTDCVIWSDMDSAAAAATLFPKQDFAAAMLNAIVPDSVQIRHEIIHWSLAA
ncbi:hypothetical protein [Primorskyibacter sp. S87]|uniref:hypothetical protein n=1 Tax=Primorskyibacter sp. S87 TaxID=3415126 RepID=UPI003C7C610F